MMHPTLSLKLIQALPVARPVTILRARFGMNPNATKAPHLAA
jgi:hypothetical protein